MNIPILGGSARHSAWQRIEEDTGRGFVDPDLQLAVTAAERTFLCGLKQTESAGSRMPSVQYHGLCTDTPARSVLRNMHMIVRQSGATTFHLKDSDDWFLHTSAGQEFQHTLPFCQDELEHLRRTWASLSQWSEWRLHTGDLTDVSLARNVLVCNDGQPALPPLFWALVHQLLHQQGLDNDDTSEEEKAVICLWTAIAVRACLKWQCSLCAVYAHSWQPNLSQEALMHPSIAPRHVDTLVFPAGSTKNDSQSVSTLAEDFLHTLLLSNLPAPVSNTIALLPRSTDDYGRRRLRITTLYSKQACGISLGRTSRDACTVPIALRLCHLCWACLPTQLWGQHAAGTWFQLSSFSEFAPRSTNLDSAHDAMTAHQLPFDAQDIHDLTYTFLLFRSRALYVIAQDQVCIPYNSDTDLIPKLLQGLPERARDILTQWLHDSQQWQPALALDATQFSTVLLYIGLCICAILLWHFECLHQPEQFQLLTHTPRSGATKYRLNEQAWGLGAPCLEVSLTSVDTDEGTPSPALSRYALTPGDKSDTQISADRAANTRTNTSQRAPHEFDASVPNWAAGVSAHDDAKAEREARDADYLDWMNRNLKIGTPSDDGEYAWDEQTLPATPDALPVTYVDLVACSQNGPYSSTFTRPMPVPVTPLAPNRQVAGLLQSAATFAPMNPASRCPHSMVQSRAPRQTTSVRDDVKALHGLSPRSHQCH